MFLRRQLKQLAYALGFGLALLTVLGLVVWSFSRPSSPAVSQTPSPTPSLHDSVIVEDTALIPHGATVDAVARLRNPNHAAGVAKLPVVFELRSPEGGVLASRVEETYLMPGSTRYVAALDIPLKANAVLAVTLPAEISFTALPPSLPLPQFNTFLYNRTRQTSGNRLLEEQKGVITNGSPFDFEKVEVAALGFDDSGSIVAVGRTFLGRLSAGEQREFTVLWQQPASAVAQVISQPSTNIFMEENIIRIIGDPALLR